MCRAIVPWWNRGGLGPESAAGRSGFFLDAAEWAATGRVSPGGTCRNENAADVPAIEGHLADCPPLWVAAEDDDSDQFAEDLFSECLAGLLSIGLPRFRSIDASEVNFLLSAGGVETTDGVTVRDADAPPPGNGRGGRTC